MTSCMKYLMTALLLVSALAFSEGLNPFDAWIPSNWELLSTTTGDINNDGVDDAVLVLEKMDPANLKPNNILGPSVLNVNPRRLLVLLKTHGTYQKILSRDNLLPSQNDEDSPCLDDPLLEQGGISIRNGKLIIKLGLLLYCGSYGVKSKTFTFRLENARLRLIGYDSSAFSRSSGEAAEHSINYLTGKKKTTTGLNYLHDTTSRPKVSWSHIPIKKIFSLDDINLNCHSNDEHGCGWDQ